MPRIRVVEIANFRSLKRLRWCPSPGMNCLIGPGDSGKSTVLDAIDLCLGARRGLQFTDADFFRLQVETPIKIEITLGELDDSLKALDTYGVYLRSYMSESQLIEDEPALEGETVLTVSLTVGSDLEPEWELYSARAAEQGFARGLTWSDRARLAPTRVGSMAGYHLTWRRGSVLNRLSDETPDIAAALAKAGRDARLAFGDAAEEQLRETLDAVANSATEMGIPFGASVRALIDPESVSFSGGTISVHSHDGIPLGSIGTGSARLLIAALQKKAATQSSIVLIDEVEHGLEPHRVVQLLGSVGVKDDPSTLQVFATTHSPVVLRELSGEQLFVLRPSDEEHHCICVGTQDVVQGTIRKYAEGFLGRSVIVCEGATEVGFLRGLDHWRSTHGHVSFLARGVVPLDGGGGTNLLTRATAFQSLGYRVAILRDSDRAVDEEAEAAFVAAGGTVVTWGSGRAIEDALFHGLPDACIPLLLEAVIGFYDENLIDEHIRSACNGTHNLAICREETGIDVRDVLAMAAKAKRPGDGKRWFKSVTRMGTIADEIVGPYLSDAEEWFRTSVDTAFRWTAGA